ncbi:MAG: hypothetical protein ACYDA6_06565, partial [Solirubrobacteraceae bacterium]
FVLLGLSGAALAVLVLARSWPRRLRLGSWAAAAVALVAAGAGALIQVDGYPHGKSHEPWAVTQDRYSLFVQGDVPPLTAAGLGCEKGIGCGFDDNTLPLAMPNQQELVFARSAFHGDRVTVPVPAGLPVGALVPTNLAGAPYFVHVEGARVVGRDFADHMVLEIAPPKAGRGAEVSLRPAESLPVVLGRVITLLALAFLA